MVQRQRHENHIKTLNAKFVQQLIHLVFKIGRFHIDLTIAEYIMVALAGDHLLVMIDAYHQLEAILRAKTAFRHIAVSAAYIQTAEMFLMSDTLQGIEEGFMVALLAEPGLNLQSAHFRGFVGMVAGHRLLLQVIDVLLHGSLLRPGVCFPGKGRYALFRLLRSGF